MIAQIAQIDMIVVNIGKSRELINWYKNTLSWSETWNSCPCHNQDTYFKTHYLPTEIITEFLIVGSVLAINNKCWESLAVVLLSLVDGVDIILSVVE